MSLTTVDDNEYVYNTMSVTHRERKPIMSNTSKNIKTYKLVEIPINNGNSTNLSCPIKQHQTFIIGEKYKIITRVLEKIYICKAYIDIEETSNQCLDVVIMKQIGGPYNYGWPLSESDCEFLKIKYEKDLLVFPATYDFKRAI